LLYEQNRRAILAHLTKTHQFELVDGDRTGIAYVYGSWFAAGSDISYQLNGGGRGGQLGPPKLPTTGTITPASLNAAIGIGTPGA
jgi:hypothetical protein